MKKHAPSSHGQDTGRRQEYIARRTDALKKLFTHGFGCLFCAVGVYAGIFAYDETYKALFAYFSVVSALATAGFFFAVIGSVGTLIFPWNLYSQKLKIKKPASK